MVGGLVALQTGGIIENCSNEGKVTLTHVGAKNATNVIEGLTGDAGASFSSAGGIAGYANLAVIRGCTNNGEVFVKTSDDSKITARHYIGGIVGQHGNTAVTHGTNNVNCTIKASAAQAVGFIWCAHSAYTSTCSIGSATEPCKVKGTLIIGDTTTTLSESNYLNYLVGFMGNPGSFPVVNNAAQLPAGSLTVYASYEE